MRSFLSYILAKKENALFEKSCIPISMRAYIFYPYYKIYSNYTAPPENANVYEHFSRNDSSNIHFYNPKFARAF